MDWAVLAPAIFSLVGVAVGAVGSFGGVLLTQRTTRQQAKAQQETARRTEKMEAVIAYLDVVEASWVLMDGLWGRRPLVSKDGTPVAPDDIDRERHQRNSEVWHQLNRLNLVAPVGVRAAARELAQRIYDATYHPDAVEGSLWNHIHPAEAAFLSAARLDLRVDDVDLLRNVAREDS